MGIGGSGMSAVAQIAAAQGYTVSGCDQQTDTPYIDKVKSAGIKVLSGHNPDHLKQADLLAVTPAVFYQNDHHPEIETARAKGILIKWQDFLGHYLHKGKFLISIAGTHGKSTTTSLAGLLLEAAGLDPTVEVGATVTAWHNNVRLGKSKYFISEADEFHDNFASYESDILILTLLEFDHPEYFGTEENMLASFQKFIDHRKPGAALIVNSDSSLISRLDLPRDTLFYSLNQAQDIRLLPSGSTFSYQGNSYHLLIPGRHNILNSLAIINLARVLHIDPRITTSVLSAFTGIGRRLELLGKKNDTTIYDDYANHPSSFSASISAVKQMYPDQKIIAVIEPHTYSRLKLLLHQLPDAVIQADEIIISKIFASRESDPGDFTGQNIADAINASSRPDHPPARYIPEFTDIVSYLANSPADTNRVILVMGSGNSYQLSRNLLSAL